MIARFLVCSLFFFLVLIACDRDAGLINVSVDFCNLSESTKTKVLSLTIIHDYGIIRRRLVHFSHFGTTFGILLSEFIPISFSHFYTTFHSIPVSLPPVHPLSLQICQLGGGKMYK